MTITQVSVVLARLVVAGLCWCLCARAEPPSAARLPVDAKRILFLGDSITHGGGYVADIETYFLTRGGAKGAEFINCGLSSETVSGLSEEGHANGQFPRPDLHERLGRVLAQIKPDLVFACYGMNDGIYLPFAEERFAKFRDGMTRLHDAVVQAGARIIHVTPPVFDELSNRKSPGYAAVLDRYSAWLVAQRTAGWMVIDLHSAMRAALEERRRADPQFTFARDGVHPDAAGHWVMARAILVGLGATDLASTPDAATMAADHPHGAEILRLVTERQALMKFAWLTATGHKRPGVTAGLPLDEARAQAAAIARRIAELR